MKAAQIPLPLPTEARLGREDFCLSDANREAYAFIDAWPAWNAPGLLLTGPEASGKTHLARIWQAQAGGEALKPEHVTLENPALLTPRPTLVENAERVASQQALLHLFNTLKTEGQSLLLTSRLPLAAWGFTLPDLVSRLNTLPRAMLHAPDDALLVSVITKHFSDRQLSLPGEVIAWLLPRMERSLVEAKRVAEALDRASLAEKRAVTLGLTRQVFEGF